MSTTQQPLVFDSDRGAPRPARPDEPLAVGALAVAAGVGQFGQPPPSAPKALPGDWGATLQAVIQRLLESGAAVDQRDPGWLDELQAAVALSQLGPYQSGRIIIGSSQGWRVLDQPAAASGLLRALVARSGAVEQIAPGVSAASLGYADVVAYGAQEPAAAVDGTLWFSEVPAQGVQVRSPAGWCRLESLLRDASTALPGLARLADAAAISNGTAGRAVDAAQLWAVRSKADAAQGAANAAQGAANAAQATADAAQGAANAAQATADAAQGAANAAQVTAAAAQGAANAAQATADGAWKPVDATTTSKGLVQLADAAAINSGTVGRIVDAAQLKAAINGPGRILNVRHFSDNGANTNSTGFVSANSGGDFVYTPVSDNSTLLILSTFGAISDFILNQNYNCFHRINGSGGTYSLPYTHTSVGSSGGSGHEMAAIHCWALNQSKAPRSIRMEHRTENYFGARVYTSLTELTVIEVAN